MWGSLGNLGFSLWKYLESTHFSLCVLDHFYKSHIHFFWSKEHEGKSLTLHMTNLDLIPHTSYGSLIPAPGVVFEPKNKQERVSLVELSKDSDSIQPWFKSQGYHL